MKGYWHSIEQDLQEQNLFVWRGLMQLQGYLSKWAAFPGFRV